MGTSMWGFLSPQNLLILNGEMMRLATALIALVSFLSTPVVSGMCADCCQRSIEHQMTVCRDSGHAHLGRHVHHMNHVHMVTQGSVASVAIRHCDHPSSGSRLSCQSTACLSAKSVQASVASVPAHRLQGSSPLIAATTSSSLTISGPLRSPEACRVTTRSSQTTSAPLRI